MALFESGEMYLETILILSRQGKPVRAVDVGAYRGYSKPSVSRGLKLLREAGLIEVAGGGAILLLPEGQRIAEKVYERHVLIRQWLRGLGVDPRTADEDACRIEHVISDESFERLKRFLSTDPNHK